MRLYIALGGLLALLALGLALYTAGGRAERERAALDAANARIKHMEGAKDAIREIEARDDDAVSDDLDRVLGVNRD